MDLPLYNLETNFSFSQGKVISDIYLMLSASQENPTNRMGLIPGVVFNLRPQLSQYDDCSRSSAIKIL